ncbi:unnamed protein product [Prorocentrum cordatum]|uniref:Pentatricopeptide repeat-containing protein n=1 Tax=Prorocentrum cordatum TaxID=2364126 RepID=A0ABN9TE64_9DINO|nr:unnamed protein product [Polarella glacialis]
MRQLRVERDVISYSSGICACEKGGQWQEALSLIGEMPSTILEPTAFGYNSGISVCGARALWQEGLSLLFGLRRAALEPDAVSYNAGIGACETGESGGSSRCRRSGRPSRSADDSRTA